MIGRFALDRQGLIRAGQIAQLCLGDREAGVGGAGEVDGGEVDTYDFRVLGSEKVDTKAGQIDAIKVERVRDPTQSSRKTVLWFAKDWGHLLVRLHQVETDGKEYQIMLKEGTVDGKPVEGRRD